MLINDSVLKYDEKIIFALRQLYSDNGYSPYKMSKFEEYELYAKNKDFLKSDGIISFNDTNGSLLALKPDVTLSIVKNSKDIKGSVQKVYYNENVYRISGSTRSYKEIMQTGLECIGDISDKDIAEVLMLANKSAELISSDCHSVVSHIGFVNSYFSDYGIDPDYDKEICTAFFDKNADGIKNLCTDTQLKALIALMRTYDSAKEAKEALYRFCLSDKTKAELNGLVSLWNKVFESKGIKGKINASVDFSISDFTGYYSGIVFKCYIKGVATAVISGGQYDGLMQKFSRSSHAIGFAVYLDELEHFDSEKANNDDDEYINVALPKGRLGEKVYSMFENAGFDCPSIKEQNRKLIFENREKKIRFFWVKPSDVAIYVARGAADIGVAGYDILLEYSPDVYELCDLNIGKCRMAVAAKKDFCDDETKVLRVATKFPNIARKFYNEKCRDIDLILLNGSIELAPILGLSDVIVDIVESGKTLKENNLEPICDIVNISARLVSNKSSYRFKKAAIERIREAVSAQVEQ